MSNAVEWIVIFMTDNADLYEQRFDDEASMRRWVEGSHDDDDEEWDEDECSIDSCEESGEDYKLIIVGPVPKGTKTEDRT